MRPVGDISLSKTKIADDANFRNSEGRPVHAVRDARKLSFERFQLPSDGREWKHVAGKRRAVYIELATYADADGTNACPSIESLQRIDGSSRRSIFRRLAELRELGLLVDVGKSKYQGTTVREIRLPSQQTDEADTISLAQLKREIERKRNNPHMRPASGNDPGGFAQWERDHRHDHPEVWQQFDAENAPMMPNSTDSPIVPNSTEKTAESVLNQELVSIVPNSDSDTAMVPNSTSTVPNSRPMVPPILAHDRPVLPTNHTRPLLNARSRKSYKPAKEPKPKSLRSENQKKQ